MKPSLVILMILLVFVVFSYWKRKIILQILLSFKTTAIEFKTEEYSRTLLGRLYVPKNKSNQMLPMILYLHGAAQRGTDNKSQLDNVVRFCTSNEVQKDFPSFVLAPQCPSGKTWTLNNDKPFEHYKQSDYEESQEIQLLLLLMRNLIEKYSIDSNRIYVFGFSMGGTAVWDIITRHPELFAAAIPIAGASDTNRAIVLNDLPVWAFHGYTDSKYPVCLSEDMANLINKAGGSCRLTIFKDFGHSGIIRKVLSEKELIKWLFSQQKNES